MSYSRQQLYALGEPLGDSATAKVGVKVIYGGGGSSSTPSTTTSVSDLPDWAKGYAQETLAKTQALTSQPYQLYGGERIAGFSPLQQQAQQSIAGLTPAAQLGQASGLAGIAGLGALNTGTFGRDAAAQYMSPFIEQAMAPQLREAQRSSDILGTQQAGQAVQAGAFGGSRAGLLEAERQRNLATQMGDIRARGYQTAYEQAANQFNQDMTRRLQGLGTAVQAAGQLGQLGQTQFGQQKDILGMQREAGAEQQALRQQGLSQAYQDFIEQQNYPYRQLGFMSDMIRGLPLGQQTSQQIYAAQPPLMSQLAGLGMGAYGLSRLAKKDGGVVGMAEGGYTEISDKVLADPTKYSEEQIRKSVKNGVLDPETAQIVLAQIARAKKAAAGINMLPSGLPTKEYAPGGIVAFDDGGEVPRFQVGGTPVLDEDSSFRARGRDALLATPFGRQAQDVVSSVQRREKENVLRGVLRAEYGPSAGVLGLFKPQTDVERSTAQQIYNLLPELSLEQMQALKAQGPSILPALMAKTPTDPREEQALRNMPATAQAPVPIPQTTPSGTPASMAAGDPTAGYGGMGQRPTDLQDILRQAEAAGARARASVPNIGLAALTPKTYAERVETAMPKGEAAYQDALFPKIQELQGAQVLAAGEKFRTSEEVSDRMDKLRTAQEARYKSKEKDIETDRDRTVGIAFLEAAQAMVQPGQTFMQGLARSGAAGGKRYMEDKERLDKRADELSDAVMRLDEARVGDVRERAKAKGDLDQALLNSRSDMIRYQQTAFNQNKADATRSVDAMLKRETDVANNQLQNEKLRADAEHNAGQRAIAAAGVDVNLKNLLRNPQLEIYTVLGNGDPRKGVTLLQQEKFDPRTLYSKYLMGREELRAKYPMAELPPEMTMQQFMARLQPSVVEGLPSGAREIK